MVSGRRPVTLDVNRQWLRNLREHYMTVDLKFDVHPDYATARGIVAEQFYSQFLMMIKQEIVDAKAERMTAVAKSLEVRTDLGALKTGLISLLAQLTPNTPLFAPTPNPHLIDREPFLLLALDIMNIAEKTVVDESDMIQIGRTYWTLGKSARNAALPEMAATCYTRAAEIYISQGRWSQVGDLYWNIAYAEAGAGFDEDAISWMHFAATVFEAAGQPDVAIEAITEAKKIQNNPYIYSVLKARSNATATRLRELHDRLLRAQNALWSAPPVSFIMITHLEGMGRIATQGSIGGSKAEWYHSDNFGEYHEYMEKRDWPRGVITVQMVDLRIIGYLTKHPDLLDNLEPRGLEIALGKMLQGFGAQVCVTPETRDGGYDVEAMFRIGDEAYRILFEAKKWKQARRVGIDAVDRLLGAGRRHCANEVCLVTTSSFSSVARKEVARLRSEVTLVERGGLLRWMEEYLLSEESQVLRLPTLRPRVRARSGEP